MKKLMVELLIGGILEVAGIIYTVVNWGKPAFIPAVIVMVLFYMISYVNFKSYIRR